MVVGRGEKVELDVFDARHGFLIHQTSFGGENDGESDSEEVGGTCERNNERRSVR